MTVVRQISDLPSPPRLPLLGNAHQLVHPADIALALTHRGAIGYRRDDEQN
jgi:hypothetical protein